MVRIGERAAATGVTAKTLRLVVARWLMAKVCSCTATALPAPGKRGM